MIAGGVFMLQRLTGGSPAGDFGRLYVMSPNTPPEHLKTIARHS